MINSVSNNLQSVENQPGFKKSQKSFFTTNEDFTNSNSKISKLMNQIQFPGSDYEEDCNDQHKMDKSDPFEGLDDKTNGMYLLFY